MNDIFYKLRSGKNNKFLYYLHHISTLLIPNFFYRSRLAYTLRKASKRKDFSYIEQRVNYYNKLNTFTPLPPDTSTLRKHTFRNVTSDHNSVYFFDSYEFSRWFPSSLKWKHCFGDITYIPDLPSIVKSRPIAGDNACSVLMKLNRIRHFIFVHDSIPFQHKKNMVIFRGKASGKETRLRFMKMFFGHPMCNLGEIGKKNNGLPAEWKTPHMTIKEHLQYKFIMALEGNDVSSNLKWIMSSNSIAVMPEPKYETWFMEGKLIPDYHYIRIKSDFTDLEERINYFIGHPEKAQEIIEHAQDYVRQFKNKKREKLISLLVMQKYFRQTGQLG